MVESRPDVRSCRVRVTSVSCRGYRMRRRKAPRLRTNRQAVAVGLAPKDRETSRPPAPRSFLPNIGRRAFYAQRMCPVRADGKRMEGRSSAGFHTILWGTGVVLLIPHAHVVLHKETRVPTGIRHSLRKIQRPCAAFAALPRSEGLRPLPCRPKRKRLRNLES